MEGVERWGGNAEVILREPWLDFVVVSSLVELKTINFVFSTVLFCRNLWRFLGIFFLKEADFFPLVRNSYCTWIWAWAWIDNLYEIAHSSLLTTLHSQSLEMLCLRCCQGLRTFQISPIASKTTSQILSKRYINPPYRKSPSNRHSNSIPSEPSPQSRLFGRPYFPPPSENFHLLVFYQKQELWISYPKSQHIQHWEPRKWDVDRGIRLAQVILWGSGDMDFWVEWGRGKGERRCRGGRIRRGVHWVIERRQYVGRGGRVMGFGM